MAGVGTFSHPVSSRASVADLWSTLDIAAVSGETALQTNGAAVLDAAARLRLRAYVQQARQYYEALPNADPAAKPLLGYYFVLNATKAFLTLVDHTLTRPVGFRHGIGQDNQHLLPVYDFDQEYLQVQPDGVFHALAANTGRGFVWSAGALQVSRLLPYLVESADLYASALGKKPSLIPVQEVSARASGSRPNREAWHVVQVSRLALGEAGISPRGLLEQAAAFAATFDLVDDGVPATATYQSRIPVEYSAMPRPLAGLRSSFDRSLIARNRTLTGGRDYVVISPHVDLVSSEALTFAMMIHLSNMVRYRPQHVEQLRGGKHWWLFSSWVDRASENFLLAMSTRVSLEEHYIA